MVGSGICASMMWMAFGSHGSDNIMISSVCRDDVRAVNVIAAGEVTCLVIDRE